MREIKFRVWNGECMVSPDYVTRDGFAIWKENSIPNMSKNITQCIGLKDKNGVEIYERDILVLTCEGYYFEQIGVVEFENCAYVFKNIDSPSKLSFNSLLTKPTSFEVIGNIHQNPELLQP